MIHKDVHHHLERRDDETEEQVENEIVISEAILHRNLRLLGEDNNRLFTDILQNYKTMLAYIFFLSNAFFLKFLKRVVLYENNEGG